MQLKWDDRNADIGVYKLVLWDDDGKKIGSEVTLWDYTCEYQADTRKNILPEHLREIAFMFGWCAGWSHTESFKRSEGLTLAEVKEKAEEWLVQTFRDALASARESVKYFEPIVAFFDKEKQKLPEITGATLLSAEEAEKLPQHLKSYKYWWWLRSPGAFRDRAACVSHDGPVYYYGLAAYYDNGCVRPALRLADFNLKVGDRFEFSNAEFEVVSDDLAFCTSDIGCCAFRRDWKAEGANVYEASDIKKFVDKWFEEAKESRNQKGL